MTTGTIHVVDPCARGGSGPRRDQASVRIDICILRTCSNWNPKQPANSQVRCPSHLAMSSAGPSVSRAAALVVPSGAPDAGGVRTASDSRDVEEEEDEEEEDVDEDGEGDDSDGNDDDDEEDDYSRLQGAVARHRQVAALAAGVPYVDSSSKIRKGPISRIARSAQKRISKARIEAIENVIPPDAGDSGWLPPPATSAEANAIYNFILQTLRSNVAIGRRCAQNLETLPQDQAFLQRSDHPTSLSEVEKRVTSSEYPDSKSFERDLCRVFLTFRRGYALGTPAYGDTCILQRLYQRMTRSEPRQQSSTVSTVRRNLDTGDAQHLYSSVAFGPGAAQRGQGSDLTTRPIIRGKVYYTHAVHKGQVLHVGDWAHLMNPSEPAKPTLAQIFKICKREDELDQPPLLSCCWYFRPEQTVHAPSRRFVPEEVFKTGLFADHTVDDVIEKVHVLFYTKWTKGRPASAEWDSRSPLYYCEARYSEKTHEFNKIKNWNSCLPEELRGSEPPLTYYREPLPPPTRVSSPFLRGVKGPGRLCEENEGSRPFGSPTPGADGGLPDPFADQSKKKRRIEEGNFPGPPLPALAGSNFSPVPHSYPGPYIPYGRPPVMTPDQAQMQQYPPPLEMLQQISETLPRVVGRGEYNRIQQLFNSPAAPTVDLQALSAGIGYKVDVPTLQRWRHALQMVGPSAPSQPMPRSSKTSSSRGAGTSAHQRSAGVSSSGAAVPAIERQLEAALGGIDVYWESLPHETVRRFGDQVGKEAQTVRWYAAPPRDDSANCSRPRPSPSLDYVFYRAQKRRLQKDGGASPGNESRAQDSTPSTGDLSTAWQYATAIFEQEQNRRLASTSDSASDTPDSVEVSRKMKELAKQLSA